MTRAVVRTNPLKNIRSMLQLNPYAAVVKKNAELVKEKNLRAKVISLPIGFPLMYLIYNKV